MGGYESTQILTPTAVECQIMDLGLPRFERVEAKVRTEYLDKLTGQHERYYRQMLRIERHTS